MIVKEDVVFFAPNLLKDELKRYASKIAAYTKLSQNSIAIIESLILSHITFVAEVSISEQSWLKAIQLTTDIDEDDTPFIALAIETGAKLWTGDKVLALGLITKGEQLTISTPELKKMLYIK